MVALARTFQLQVNKQVEMNGSGTRSSLMYETIRIVQKLKPKYVIWENVKNLLSKKHRHNFDNYLDKMTELGYRNYYQVLNAKDYGIPQNRERVFTISIRNDINNDFHFPEKKELKLRLKDILEENVDEKYYLSDKQVSSIKASSFVTNQRRIQEKDYSDTLCARDWKDPKCVQVGELDIKGQDCIKRVYSEDGLSPTLTNMQGGNRQPKIIEEPFIVASRGRGPENPSSRETGIHTEQRLEPNTKGLCNTITSVQKDNYVAEPKNLKQQLCDDLISQGIVKGGEIINHSYTNSEQRNTLDKYIESDNGILPTMTTRPDILGYVELNTSIKRIDNTINNHKQEITPDSIIDGYNNKIINDGIHPTITARINDSNHALVEGQNSLRIKNNTTLGYQEAKDGDSVNLQQPNSTTRRARVGEQIANTLQTSDTMGVVENLRIRKLTPKECWRLMGFTDEEFEKAQKVNSNAQLYKQAGNSIVVNVLEEIFKQLFK